MDAQAPRAGRLAHFAINADDLDAAQRFYAAVFGWTFDDWGPAGFFKILTQGGELPGPIGELTFFADPSGNVCGAMRYEDAG